MDENQQLDLLQKLIQCKSVTPESGEAIDLIAEVLSEAGFRCTKLKFGGKLDDSLREAGGTSASGVGSACLPFPAKLLEERREVMNLYAEFGQGERNLCFAGHVDVVPAGNEELWSHLPFEGVVKDGNLYGRGAVDMKSGLAACISAATQYVKKNPEGEDYKLSFMISGDEEWESKNGTIKLLEWLKQQGRSIEACVVVEPTSQKLLGDVVKNGSRGSLLFKLVVNGVQGHVAYNKEADNPITRLVKILHDLKQIELDRGTEFFEPSNLEVTNVEVGNSVSNLIPAAAAANFCIRFNDRHTVESLLELVRAVVERHAEKFTLSHEVSGQAYIVKDKHLIDVTVRSVEQVTGRRPLVSAGGATSDARFIKDICPVIELGPLIATAHKIDEHIPLEHLYALTRIYGAVIENFFERKD